VQDTLPPLSPPPSLVGRDDELDTLRAGIAAAFAGHGRLMLIHGEAGIGKTALAEVLCHEAAAAGAHVLTGSCYDRMETPPYGPWIEIVRRIPVLPDVAQAPPVPSLDGARSQADLFAQARDFLVGLTAQRPLLVVLEDLHWADTASLDLLRFIAQRLDDLPLLLVGTYRGEEVDRGHPLAATIPLLVREAPTERLSLRPLEISAVEALVRARHALAEPAVHRLAAYLIERTEGNALFLTELLRSLEEDRLLDRFAGGSYAERIAQTPVPSLLQQIVDDRLTRLGDDTAALLAVAAVVGQEVPLAVWEAVTHVDEETLLDVADRAEAAHLVTASARIDGIRFTHALIHDVLYEHVIALRRRGIHRQVAEALIALPSPDPDAVASHLQQAGDARAAAWLTRAGERAEDAYALVTAAARYEVAFTLLDAQQGDVTERGWLRLLAAALRRYEDVEQSLAWVEEAVRLSATAGDPSLTARAQALRGQLLGSRGDYRNAVATTAAAADIVDRLPPGSGTTRRREQLIDMVASRGNLIFALAYGGRLAEARAQSENFLARFTEPATTPGELGAIADAHMGLALACTFQGEPVQARRAYAAAIAAYEACANHVAALINLREELIHSVLPYQADDLAERERVAAAAERMAVRVIEAGGDVNPNLPRYTRVPLLVLEGRWREAREILEPPDPSDMATVQARALYRGALARAQGDVETAWRCVHEPSRVRAASEPGERVGPLPLPYQLLAAALALDTGDLETARDWLDLHRRWLVFMDATLGRAEEATMEAEWHRAAGDTTRARHYAEEGLRWATRPRQPLAMLAAHRMLGTLAADAGDRISAEPHFAQALALADACRAPYERALTLIALAELLTITDDLHRARALLDEARALCLPMDAIPALAQIERIAALLDDTNDRLLAGLSTRETEVLRLVAAGLSNVQIAERLFLSPNTVRVHLANLFAKIGVHNRAAAAAFAHQHGIV
jgi:ATP/maltotriose-dependent transcriptional regulator MalT